MARILIIEDDVPVRMVIKRMIEAEGHEVVEASDGQSGIDMYRKSPTDLVITDIVMPKKEGLETIKELRKDFPDVRIIAISGGGKVQGKQYLELARKFGAMATFEKPFTWKKLLDTVNGLLSRE
jgi:DNA-binding response OmpR family regulator